MVFVPFSLLGDVKVKVKLSVVFIFTIFNLFILSALFGISTFGEGMFSIGYSVLTGTSLSFVIDLIQFLNRKMSCDNFNLTEDDIFKKTKIFKKHITKSIFIFILILLVPIILFAFTYPISIFILNLSLSQSLAFYYFLLLPLGSVMSIYLKNIVLSSKAMLKVYDQILYKLPTYVPYLYFKACLFASINNPEACIEILETIIKLDNTYIRNIQDDNIFNMNNIKYLERFQKLLKVVY